MTEDLGERIAKSWNVSQHRVPNLATTIPLLCYECMGKGFDYCFGSRGTELQCYSRGGTQMLPGPWHEELYTSRKTYTPIG